MGREVYAVRVVELGGGQARTRWQSTGIAGLPAGEQPMVAVDEGGTRWAALVRRVGGGWGEGGGGRAA